MPLEPRLLHASSKNFVTTEVRDAKQSALHVTSLSLKQDCEHAGAVRGDQPGSCGGSL